MPEAPRIVVTPEHELDAVCSREDPERIVSFGSPERPPARPASPAPWCAILFHDIPEPRDGMQAATAEDIDALLAQATLWTGRRPLVLQCWMGISRSTAAALAVLCARGVVPGDAADMLREASPEATPNPHVVALADRRLALGGRLIAAVQRIGRGREAATGKAFALDLSL